MLCPYFSHDVLTACLQEEGNLEAAIQCYELALSIDVHYAKSSLLLGILYRQRGRPHDLTLAQVGLAVLSSTLSKPSLHCSSTKYLPSDVECSGQAYSFWFIVRP